MVCSFEVEIQLQRKMILVELSSNEKQCTQRDEFCALMTETTKNMSGGVNSTQSAKKSVQSEIAAFLKASVEQGTIAQARADLRQKWIKKIVHLSGKKFIEFEFLTRIAVFRAQCPQPETDFGFADENNWNGC